MASLYYGAPRNAAEQEARAKGYKGGFGGGGYSAFVAGKADASGNPKPAPVAAQPKPIVPSAPTPQPATPAPQIRYDPKSVEEQALIKAGYNQGFGGGGATAWRADPQNMAKYQIELEKLSNPASSQTGVMPVGMYEPLHDYSKNVLQTQGQLAPTSADMGRVKSIFEAALEKAKAGSDPTQNPQLMGAINSAREQSLETRRRLNPSLDAAATSAGAFGSTRDAVQRALSDEMIGKNFDNWQAQTMYDAYWKGLDQNLRQASAQSDLGQRELGLFDYLSKGALSAGDRIQGEGQRQADIARAEEMAKAGYGRDLIDWYMTLLNKTRADQVAAAPQSVSPVQGALGGAMLGNSIYSNMFSGISPNYTQPLTSINPSSFLPSYF